MAKLTLIKNIFDLNDSEIFSIASEMKISDFLNEQKILEGNYSCLAEVYDPDTEETSWVSIDDNDTGDIHVSLTCNGNPVGIDYIMKPEDDIIIQILPASKNATGGALAFSGWGMWASAVSLLVIGISNPWVVGGLMLAGVALAIGGGLIAASDNQKEGNKRTANEQQNIPTINGAQNQSQIGNAYPAVIGKTYITPFVVGSPYVDYDRSETFDESWLGTKQKMYLLLNLGYAPLMVKDICLDQLPLAKNPNNVLSGIMSYKTDSKGNLIDDSGNPVTFNDKKLEAEIGQSWASNKIKIELSQLGHERTIYPYTVNYEPMKDALLYCYDKMYKDIADEANLVTWQGGVYPTGLRTNTIHFSRSVPYKIQVGINFPSGLYRTRSVDGDNEYTKIPMNLVVQWRPYYKYLKDNEVDINVPCPDTYDHINPTYNRGRYGKWRNFDRDSIVPTIKYVSNESYVWYELNGKPFYSYQSKSYVCFRTLSDLTAQERSAIEGCIEGSFIDWDSVPLPYETEIVQEKLSRSDIKSILYKRASAYYGKTSPTGKQRVEICINGKKCVYSTTWHWGVHKYTTTPEQFAENNADEVYNAQDRNYFESHKNEHFIGDIAKRECQLNVGLSEGTSFDCNPKWNGVSAFSFGQYSGGADMYRKDSSDPSLTDHDVSYKEYKDGISTAKNEMQFELTATLTQEDILDLINRNPASIEAGNESSDGQILGKTDVVFDSIEVRIVRLTPCYIDKTKGDSNYTYSDIVKWNYIKSYTIDKNKLLDDIDYKQEGKKFAKINCDPLTWTGWDTTDMDNPVDVRDEMRAEGSSMFNSWNIDEYKSKPFSDEDAEKMVTMGFEVYPDKLGNLTGNMDKVNCTAMAITPSLLKKYVRYWYKSDDACHYYDSYDDPDSMDFSNLGIFMPDYNDVTQNWLYAPEEEFNNDSPIRIGNTDYYYCIKDKVWERKFFPEKVEEKYGPELYSDYTGVVKYNPDGSPITTTVKVGSTWLDQIKNEVNRYKDSSGRSIASDSFIKAFTEKNAIAQALGFMIGGALGKDSYTYNSLPESRFVRFWDASDGKYRFMDTDYSDFVTATNNMFRFKWVDTTKEFFDKANPTFIMGSTYWSYRDVEGSFNMLALKEAYDYTDNIDIGGNDNSCQYNCNMYIYQQQKVQELLRTILTAGRAYWFYDDRGRIEIHNDRPLDNPVLLLTDENVISSSNQRSFRKGIAGYHIMFQDENNNGEQGEIYVLRQGQTREKHTRDIKDLQLTGVTTNKQARGLGLYMLAQSIIQRENWTKKLNHIGSALTIGSLVRVQSSSLKIGTDSSGRVERLVEGTEVVDGRTVSYIYGFILDNMYEYRCEYNDDGSNVQGCSIMQASKGDRNRIVTLRFANKTQQENGVSAGGVVYRNYKTYTNLVLFEKKIIKDTGEIEDPGDGISAITEFNIKPGDVVAFGNVGSITSDAIVYSITPDEKNHYSVGLYPYAPEVYSAGASFPSYDANITKKPLVDAPLATDMQISMEIKDSSRKTYSDANSKIDSTKTELEAKIDAIETNAVRIYCSNPNLVFHKKDDNKANEEHIAVDFRLMVNEIGTKCDAIEVSLEGVKGITYNINGYDDVSKTYTVELKSRFEGTAPEGFVTVTLTWNGTKYTQDVIIESTSDMNYLGGKYYDEIPTDIILGDYFTYLGTKDTPEKDIPFIPSVVYIAVQDLNEDGDIITRWDVDGSQEHMMTAIDDIMSCVDISKNAMAYAFIQRLVANSAFIQNLFAQEINVGNYIQSANFKETEINPQGQIISPGTGFKFNEDGKASLNSVELNGMSIQYDNRSNFNLGRYNFIKGTEFVGNNNFAIGNNSSMYITSGDNNISIGDWSLSSLSSGNDNIAIGRMAGSSIIGGGNNICIGPAAGTEKIKNGSGNILIGAGIDVPTESDNYSNIIIGSAYTRYGEPAKYINIGNSLIVMDNYINLKCGGGNPEINICNLIKYSGTTLDVTGSVSVNGTKLSAVKKNDTAVSSVNFAVSGKKLIITTTE